MKQNTSYFIQHYATGSLPRVRGIISSAMQPIQDTSYPKDESVLDELMKYDNSPNLLGRLPLV
jgi:hypothetical protein